MDQVRRRIEWIYPVETSWTSNIDGKLPSEANALSTEAILSAGEHTITFSAAYEDPDPEPGTSNLVYVVDTVTIQVNLIELPSGRASADECDALLDLDFEIIDIPQESSGCGKKILIKNIGDVRVTVLFLVIDERSDGGGTDPYWARPQLEPGQVYEAWVGYSVASNGVTHLEDISHIKAYYHLVGFQLPVHRCDWIGLEYAPDYTDAPLEEINLDTCKP